MYSMMYCIQSSTEVSLLALYIFPATLSYTNLTNKSIHFPDFTKTFDEFSSFQYLLIYGAEISHRSRAGVMHDSLVHRAMPMRGQGWHCLWEIEFYLNE